jgi:hypothetical protein
VVKRQIAPPILSRAQRDEQLYMEPFAQRIILGPVKGVNP